MHAYLYTYIYVCITAWTANGAGAGPHALLGPPPLWQRAPARAAEQSARPAPQRPPLRPARGKPARTPPSLPRGSSGVASQRFRALFQASPRRFREFRENTATCSHLLQKSVICLHFNENPQEFCKLCKGRQNPFASFAINPQQFRKCPKQSANVSQQL